MDNNLRNVYEYMNKAIKKGGFDIESVVSFKQIFEFVKVSFDNKTFDKTIGINDEQYDCKKCIEVFFNLYLNQAASLGAFNLM